MTWPPAPARQLRGKRFWQEKAIFFPSGERAMSAWRRRRSCTGRTFGGSLVSQSSVKS
jgi:hypothetical protein